MLAMSNLNMAETIIQVLKLEMTRRLDWASTTTHQAKGQNGVLKVTRPLTQVLQVSNDGQQVTSLEKGEVSYTSAKLQSAYSTPPDRLVTNSKMLIQKLIIFKTYCFILAKTVVL